MDDDEMEMQEYTSDGKYDVTITTGQESSEEPCPSDASVNLVVYGEDGKTGEVLLKGSETEKSDETDYFKPGLTNDFQIDVPDIGRIYKVRLTLDHQTKWRGWLVEDLALQDTTSKQLIKFSCKRWLSKYEDDLELVREFPVTSSNQDSLPVKLYCINVTTGDRHGASTDANVFVTLRGERGDTGRRKLTLKKNFENLPFQRNSTTSFEIEAVDLGLVNEVVVGHDGKGYGAGWFLEKLAVKESAGATAEWVFPAHSWFDDHIGDCETIRRLRLLGQFDLASHDSEKSIAEGDHSYDVTVTVDEVMTQANSVVKLQGTVYGKSGKTASLSLGDWRPGREKKYTGKADLSGLGEIEKLRVEMDESHLELNLFLINVTLQSNVTSELLSFNFQRHFRSLSGTTVKELPVLQPDQPCRKLVSYLIGVEMSPSNDDVASQGKLQLRLVGRNGDSGFRTLFRGMDGFSATKSSNGYVFEHESVDLGKLEEVALAYVTDDETSEGGWKMGQIAIKDNPVLNHLAIKTPSDLGYVASVDRVFDPSTGLEHTCLLHPCQLEPSVLNQFKDLINVSSASPVKEITEEPSSLWRLIVTTSAYNQVSLFNQITIRFYGTLDCSESISLSTAEVTDVDVSGNATALVQDRTMELKLDADLGLLYQMRLRMSNESSVTIYKIKLISCTTGEVFLCCLNAEDRLNPSDNQDGVLSYDFPLVKPDHEPLHHHSYQVNVRTEDVASAETDSDVFLQILGELGSTGSRSLKKLGKNPDVLFQRGQTDLFNIETVDIGEPEKMVLSHSASGRGAGWYPVDVTIKETRNDVGRAYIFSCLKWFDDGVDDKLIKREFFPSATRLVQPEVDGAKSTGNWKCYVTTKPEVIGQDELPVKFTFCVADKESYDREIIVNSELHEFDLTFDQHESIDDATVHFVKLRTKLEEMTERTKKSWPLSEVNMLNEASGEKLRFVFDNAPVWEGSGREDVRELPVVRFNQPYQPVHNYHVIFYTSNQSNDDFVASRVSCQLCGQDGDTGWRDIVTSDNASGKFRPGRIDMFVMEAVHLGDVVDHVMLRLDGQSQSDWTLEKVKVKRDYYEAEEQIFEYEREIPKNEIVELILTDSEFNPPSMTSSSSLKLKSEKKEIQYSVKLVWDGLSTLFANWHSAVSGKTASRDIPTLSVQLGGTKGCSDIVPLDLSKTGDHGSSEYQLEIPVVFDSFGDLVKVGVGVMEPALPMEDNSSLYCMLRKVCVRNQETNQYYGFRLKHNFFAATDTDTRPRLTGLNWIELVATQPRQDPATIAKACTYVITLRTAEHEEAGTRASVYATLIGENGDSGKRWLIAPSNGGEAAHSPGKSLEFVIESTFLDDLKQVIIGHDGRDVTAGWYLDDVTVTSSLQPKMQYVFNCKKWLANLEEDTFIERTLTLDRVVTLDQ